MRAGMFLSLLYEVHAAERSLISHLLRLHIFRRKEQLFGVEQQHARLATCVDHRVRFLEGHAERLLAKAAALPFVGEATATSSASSGTAFTAAAMQSA